MLSLCLRRRSGDPRLLPAVLAQARSRFAARPLPPVSHLQKRHKSTVGDPRDDGLPHREAQEACTRPSSEEEAGDPAVGRGSLLTLAIETSCDDTCVAVMEKERGGAARLLFEERVTADCRRFGGIQPFVAVESHTARLPGLVDRALRSLGRRPPGGPAERSRRTFAVGPDGPGPAVSCRVPDFVSVTRGPGIPTALAVGLNLAKGLAAAWQVPLVGVHHMQAHALTPRMVSALARGGDDDDDGSSSASAAAAAASPDFPFLTLLVSGGHTLLLRSGSLTSHRILAQAHNIAIGDCLDKAARVILPLAWLPAAWAEERFKEEYRGLQVARSSAGPSSPSPSERQPGAGSVSFGALLEKFAFPNGMADYVDSYRPPASRAEEIRTVHQKRPSPDGVDLGTYTWALSPPGNESKKMEFDFSGFLGSIVATVQKRKQEGEEEEEESGMPASSAPTSAAAPAAPGGKPHASLSDAERRAMAREAMRLLFENLGSRAIMALQDERRALEAGGGQGGRGRGTPAAAATRTLVVSGGVASNGFLRHVLRSMLDARGFGHVEVVAPPPRYCTDNAAMIAWAGIEMYEQGWTTDSSVLVLKEWTVDPADHDGGIMGPPGWIKSAASKS